MSKHKRDAYPWWVILFDIAMINLAMGLAYLLRYRLQWFLDVVFDAPYRAYLPFNFLFTVGVPVVLWLTGSYANWRGRVWLDHLFEIVSAVGITLIVGLAWSFVVRPLVYSRLLLFESAVFMIGLIALDRAIVSLIQSQLRRRGRGLKRIVIVGVGEVGRRVMRTVVARPDLGYRIVGYVDDNPDKGTGKIGRFQGFGSIDNLSTVIDTEEVDEVIITLPWNYHRRILSVLRACARRDVRARLVPDLFQMSLSRVEVGDLGGLPLIEIQEIAFSRSELVVKRILDLVVSSIGLLLGWPIVLLIAIAIKLDSKGPVLFVQDRVGQHGQRFKIYKFRTMRQGAEEELPALLEQNEAEGPIFKMRNDPRITRVGQWLRQSSLDELPQLINVLRGEMSLVGPRPPLPAEVEAYQPWHTRRLRVPPGITGLWQVSGRSELTFDEMVLLDLYYIEHWSPWMDIAILLRTVPKVVAREGAY
ncbi:MAG: undecaprenyl-phosphate glucose phosphotransferase [Anaerolineae bacterium]|nr:undecaprenyl-phosphate glucose phosphotransferase [Anaerolineae bacterium]